MDNAVEQTQLAGLLGPSICASVLNQIGIISVTDVKGRIVYANDEFVRLSKFSREELIGQDHRLLNSGHHSQEFFREMYRTIGSGDKWRSPIKNRAKDGSFYWVDALIFPLKAPAGKITGYVSVRLDITSAVNAHVALQERDHLLQAILDNFPGGIAVFDNNLQMLVCNDQQKALLEYPDSLFKERLPSLEALLRFNAMRGEYGDGDVEEHVASRLALARENTAHSYERARPNGCHLEVRGSPLADGGFVSTHFDITERKRSQAMIEQLALHDALTGLSNRRRLRDRLQVALARVKRGDKVALLYLDLDRFKAVNDTLGHPVGDLLLQQVAERLKSETRAMDTVARLGGDEFAVLQVGIATRSDASELAGRLIKEISEPFLIGGHSISIGTSVGIAISPTDTVDPDRLLKCADLALYNVKASAKGAFKFFEPAMDERALARHRIETGLRRALENNELELHYQPIVRTIDGQVTSCEALLRWRHPERGLISAGEFIPVAEEAGLIRPIGDWVLREACQEALNWPDHVSVSVNVSVAQFRGRDFATSVLGALGNLHPSRLIIEITETIFMQKDRATIDMLQWVRDAGVRFALDDFGTGYSSLSYLQSFPFDKIKIDRSFIASVLENERSRTLLSAIAGLGKALNMSVVAEGVETKEQFDFVTSQGCSEAQGLFLADSLPAHTLRRRLFSTAA